MNPFKLIREGTDTPVAQACGQCGVVYTLENTARAEECCDRELRETRRKAADAERNERFDREHAERQARYLREAKRVLATEYTGPVYVEESDRGNDGFFSDITALCDEYESEGDPLPDVVWGCFCKPFRLPSAAEIVTQEAEGGDYHDEIEDQLTDTKDLQAAIDAWNARQTAETWEPDYGTLIVFAPVPA